MGTYCTLKSATADQLFAIKANPQYLSYFYDPENCPLPEPSLLRRIFGRSTETPLAIRDLSDCMEISLDKAWDGLNYLFTHVSDDEVAGLLLDGGRRISENARMVFPAELREFRDFVHSMSEVELRAAYDPADMTSADVYPSIIWPREGEDAFDWIMEFHQQLWAFLRDAVDEGHGCIIWIAA